jgi:hypothetical protein
VTTVPLPTSDPGTGPESVDVEHYLDLPLGRREKEIRLESWMRAVGQARWVGVPGDAQTSVVRINDGRWVARFFWTTAHAVPPDGALPRMESEVGREVLVPGRVIVKVASGTWEVRDPRLTRLDPPEDDRTPEQMWADATRGTDDAS